MIERVMDRQSTTFVELYGLVEQARCLSEVDFNDFFCRERFEILYRYMQERGLSSLSAAFDEYSPTAYSGLLQQ